jgi:hypothetical protein
VGGLSVEADARMGEAKSLNQPQDLPDQQGRHPTVSQTTFSTASVMTHR